MRKELATLKIYFFKGWQYAQLPAIGVSAAYALEQKYGIPFVYSIILGVIVCVGIGAFDYWKGIARPENDLGWTLTPCAIRLLRQVDGIENDMKRVKDVLDRLDQKQTGSPEV